MNCRTRVSVGLSMYPHIVTCNNSIKTFPRQRRFVGVVIFCTVLVVSKESRRLVLPRTSWSVWCCLSWSYWLSNYITNVTYSVFVLISFAKCKFLMKFAFPSSVWETMPVDFIVLYTPAAEKAVLRYVTVFCSSQHCWWITRVATRKPMAPSTLCGWNNSSIVRHLCLESGC
jgi:hypothetical protein